MKGFSKTLVLASSLMAVSIGASADYRNDHTRQYEITLTNITKGISFTPFLAASHNRHIALFEVGEEASEEIGAVAEGGDISGLNAQLEDSYRVADTASTEGLLAPGASTTVMLESRRGYGRFSLVSMLLPTNDSMAALQGAKLPRRGSQTYFLNAYDAGTETNDESCANIPGPHCGGVPFSPEDEGEGYIYPASGIHGEGDLSREAYQFDGPVVKVTVRRVY